MKLLTTHYGLPRLSWGSIIAGVILSMIVYLVMSVLGTAVGASLLAPLSRPDPLQGFGFGSGVWVIVTTVIAVFVGSYYARRCAPVLGWLHGLLARGRDDAFHRLWDDFRGHWRRQYCGQCRGD